MDGIEVASMTTNAIKITKTMSFNHIYGPISQSMRKDS